MTFGTWGIGGAGWDANSDETRLDAIAAAVECGINFIDTAPAYNAGKAERYIGKALDDLGHGWREKVLIATKCANAFIDGQYVRSGKADLILRQCDESLQNLRTDHIDLLIVHWPDPVVPYEETFEALQVQFSMVDMDNLEVMQWAHEQDLGVMTYGSLGGGILTGRYRTIEKYEAMDSRNRFYPYFKEPMFSKVMKLLDVMQTIADARGVQLAEIAMNWSRQKPFVDTSIFGAQKRSRIESNAKCMDWELTAEEMLTLDEAIAEIL